MQAGPQPQRSFPHPRGRRLAVTALILILGGTSALMAQAPDAAPRRSIFGQQTPEAVQRHQAAAIWLWAGDAPEARGTAPEDVPLLYPVLPAAAAARPRPVMLVLPGGGYNHHSAGEAFPIAEQHRDAGFAAFVLQYRLLPYSPAVALRDAQRAVRIIRARSAELNIDPNRIAVVGFSAGGHLAANLATHGDDGRPDDPDPIERLGCRVHSTVLFYPAIVRAPAGQMIAGQRDLPTLLQLDGLHQFVDARTPPAFLIVGYDDSRVPYTHCLAYAAQLHRAGVRFELHILGEGEHGGSTRELRRAEWQPLLQRWFTTVGLDPQP